MTCNVFANNNEIACKKGSGKVIAEFPDVCLSPPSPPAGPIPVPYPDTSFAKDMRNGSKTVKIKGGPVMLKDKSFYKSSPLGDEAATRSFGANVITHTITGKTFFVAWSMDVKFEGQNVDRHMDLTTSNHISPPGGTPPSSINLGTMAAPAGAAGGGKDEECECCGNDKHSTGPEVTEDKFYNTPQSQATLEKIRSSPNCKQLLPEPPCNKYYIASKAEKDAIETKWNNSRTDYLTAKGLKGKEGISIGHRVPKCAGGCPDGDGNLTPVGPDCKDLDDELMNHQDRRIKSHRKRLGIT